MKLYMDSIDTIDHNLEKIMKLIGDKWSVRILYYLHQNGPSRFGDCQKAEDINTKTLTQRLITLEKAGVINRVEYSEYPPRTEYSLTKKGEELIPTFTAMSAWAKKHLS